jgi:hypothetical protein
MLRIGIVMPLIILALSVCLHGFSGTVQAQSPADCQAYAKRVEMDSGSMLGGAARGAARGALFGAIVGGSKETKRGAALGAAVGGTRTAVGKSEVYKRAYDDCMAGRVKW